LFKYVNWLIGTNSWLLSHKGTINTMVQLHNDTVNAMVQLV